MRVGGPADLFAVAHNLFELRGLVRYARARSIPLFLLGRGSDLVIADAGIRGPGRPGAGGGDAASTASASTPTPGVPMARAATESQKAGLGGLEYGLAIPGTAGGSVWANAGAHDSDTAGVLESATVVLADGTEREIPVDELGFTYRHSRFKDAAALADGDPGEVVLSTTCALRRGGPGRDPRPARRDPPLAPGAPAAGPAVGGLGVPQPATGDSAGRLIDELGLKGHRIGGAVVSEKHANFIVNDQRGTAADVRRLAEHVRGQVLARHGVDLAFEVEFAGDWSGWPTRRPPDARVGRVVAVPPLGHDPASTPVAVVLGGPVGGARRLDRVRDGDRSTRSSARATRSRPG